MSGKSRIQFEEAITEPSLLKGRFEQLSVPQQVALKLLYGVQLNPHKTDPQTGFSEVDYWAIFHGAVETDPLGYPLKVLPGAPPYAPKEYREGILIFGRRSGKTDHFSSTIVAYEATCGGHEDFLAPRQIGICFQVAQDLRMARNALHFIRAAIESSRILTKEIRQITADRIDLRNNLTIACVPATLKSVRGFASPVAVLDEVGVWYQEAESANPDYEIYRALSPAQLQFPDRRIALISSPWNKAGLLYQYDEAGTGGYKLPYQGSREQYRDSLVIKGPTPVMNNPLVTRDFLHKEQERDPQAYEREILARFQDSISGFIPSGLVAEARDEGILERPHDPRWLYYAAIDPAFRRDAFAFTILHREDGVIVQDVVRRFMGGPDQPLTPAPILDVIIPLLKQYRLGYVYSDQYHLESLGQLLRDRGAIEIIGVPFTARSKAEMYGNLQQLFLQKKIRLLDDYETIREIKSLERTLTGGGTVQIAAPAGLHDDLASVVCLAAAQAMWAQEQKVDEKRKSPGDEIHAMIQAQIARKWQGRGEAEGTWD